MPLDFEESFFIAFRTFRHQRVFCPEKQQIETLYPIAGSNHKTDPNEVWPFLGEYIEPSIASKIADGSFHPSLKIPWSEALKQKQQHPTHQSNAVNDLEIHHRRSASNIIANGGGRNRRGASNKEKTNVWHSLIYGSKDDSQNSRHHQQPSQPPHDGKENNASSKRDMFSFFPQNKRQGSKEDDTVEQSQPPVPEIYVGNDDSSTSLPKSKSKSNYVPPAHHRDIPIHFNEYASRLVGRAFKPISRKRKKQELDGTKSSKYVQKIWEKCAKIQRPVLMQNQAPTGEVTTAEKEEAAQGVSRFKKVSEVECHDASQDTYFHAPIHDSTYQDVERDATTTTHNQQYDALPDFSVHNQLDADDDPYHDVYEQSNHDTCDDQAYEERSVRSSQEFGRSDTTSHYEERGYNIQASSYSHHHEELPQSYEDEPRVVAFKDDHDNIIEEEYNLFAELQSLHDDPTVQQHEEEYGSNMSHYGSDARYDYQTRHDDQCDDAIEHITDDFSQHNPFNQLQTVMKKKPATRDSSHQGNYMMGQEDNHAEHNNIFYEDDGNVYADKAFDGRGYTDADYDDAPEDEQISYNPFAQLKTVKKPQVSFRSY